MAAESSTTATSGRSGGGGASADSYIGSLISLTSKSEIRYEGILYNINTEESSIGLRNVRSFGTEGRKKDGPLVPPSDKIYEYILFRGSDIKDLQVKASPLVQTAPPQPINSDPAIIQSHYPLQQAPPASLPAPSNGSLPDHAPHSSQMGLSGSTFPNNLHLYQPGPNLNSWGPSPPNANGPLPMYWSQGYYGPPNGLPQLPQQSLLRPPPGLSIPPTMQQMQFSGYNSTLPDYHSSLVPNSSGAPSLTSTTFSLSVPSLQPISLVSDTLISPLPNKAPVSGIPTMTSISNLPSLAQHDSAGLSSVASKPSIIAGPPALPQNTVSQPVTSFSGPSASVRTETRTPSLVTPGQLLHSAPAPSPAPAPAPVPFKDCSNSGFTPAPDAASVAQTLQTMQKDVEVVQVSSKPLPEPLAPVAPEVQPPILPLPVNTRSQKPNGGGYQMRNNYRGRGGRGPVISRPVARFTEDFDFTAMNEKFKKDEVWGHLGKTNKSQTKDKDETGSDDEDDSQGEYDAESPKMEAKSVYNKDDFFDSLSCNALNNDPNHGRTRYSEQMKLDTETFGDFSRYRGGRGGYGPGRGGGRFRGSYHGRGYGGYGGYYVGRGRGRGIQSQSRPL